MDGYNFGTETFDQIFHWTYDKIINIAPTKPMMIAETAAVESVNKAAWFTDMLSTQLPINYGQIKALVYWQGPTGGAGSEITFLVESSPEALAAFRQGIASSYYGSNVYSSLNASPIIAPSGPMPTPVPTPQPTSTPWNPYPTPTPSLNPTPLVLCLVLVSVSLILLLWVWRCLRSCHYIRKLFARSRVSVNIEYLFLEDSNAKKNFRYSFSRLPAVFFSSFFLYSSY